MYEELYTVYEKLCGELCDYGRQDLTMDNLKTIDTLAHAGKNVLKLMENFEGSSGAYYDEDPRYTAMGSRRGSYRISHKRDSMGRYSREGDGGGSYGASRAGGNNVTDGLRELMYAAPAEMQGEINRLIKKLDNM